MPLSNLSATRNTFLVRRLNVSKFSLEASIFCRKFKLIILAPVLIILATYFIDLVMMKRKRLLQRNSNSERQIGKKYQVFLSLTC